jgi:hypothetical protein
MFTNSKAYWGRLHAATCGLLAAIVGLIACSIDDNDRCAGDFVWNSKYLACVCPKGKEWVGEGNTCKKVVAKVYDDTDVADSGTDSDGQSAQARGLGKPCTADSDCYAYQAHRCVPSTSSSYCSIECESRADCGSGYACCSCVAGALSEGGTACIREADVALAESVGGCECK